MGWPGHHLNDQVLGLEFRLARPGPFPREGSGHTLLPEGSPKSECVRGENTSSGLITGARPVYSTCYVIKHIRPRLRRCWIFKVHLLSCALCLSSPVEWSPTTYAPYGGGDYTQQEEGIALFWQRIP